MSGPKSSSYDVVSPEELERRKKHEAKARCDVLRQILWEIYKYMGDSSAMRLARERGPAVDTSKGYEQLEAEFREEEKAASEKLRVVRAARVAAALAGSAAALGIPAHRGAADKIKAADKILNSLSSVRNLVASIEDEPTRIRLIKKADLVESLADAHPQKSKAELLSLQTEASREYRAQQAATKLRRDVRDAVLEIAHIEGDEADHIRARADNASTAAEVAALRSEVKNLVLRMRKKEDADFVAGQVLEVLGELYGTGGEGAYVQVEGSEMYAYSPKLEHNALMVKVNADACTLETRVVALDDIGAEEIGKAEKEVCQGVYEMHERLRSRGVESEFIYRELPGAVPAQRHYGKVEAKSGKRNAVGKAGKKRVAAARGKEMTMP